MKSTLMLIAAFLISLAWLLPVHYRPWVTYTGELYAFVALFALGLVYIKDKIQLPSITLPIFALGAIPFVHFLMGHVYFFSIALMGSIFVLSFWVAIMLGYNLSIGQYNRTQTFGYLSHVFLVSGTVTGLIAICQWANLDSVLPGMINISGSTRPFANFAQPNNMATFLMMSLMACLYLYEQRKLATKWLVACAVPIVIGVALSQSRTAWVAAIAILLYLGFYQYKRILRLKLWHSLAWVGFFIFCIWLFPLLSQLVAQISDAEVIRSRGVIARATGDMSRMAIWKQMLAAIAAEPWWGYGWYQTSAAFVSITDSVQGPVWIRSSHNFIIDFLVWNGAVVGVPFLAYFGYLGYQLQRFVKTPESVIGMAMIGAFITHAMFEFPQHYAYFLLPVGFILGTVLAQRAGVCKSIMMPPIFMQVVVVIGALLLVLIYRDYNTVVPKIGESIRYEKQPEKIQNQQSIYLLTEFNHRIEWIRLNPYSAMHSDEIHEYEKLIVSYPTKYNMLKYVKLLAFNGYIDEAKHHVWRLNRIQKTHYVYEDVIAQMPK